MFVTGEVSVEKMKQLAQCLPRAPRLTSLCSFIFMTSSSDENGLLYGFCELTWGHLACSTLQLASYKIGGQMGFGSKPAWQMPRGGEGGGQGTDSMAHSWKGCGLCK